MVLSQLNIPVLWLTSPNSRVRHAGLARAGPFSSSTVARLVPKVDN